MTTPQELEGKEAVDFAERHLRKLQANPLTWEVGYENPKTGEKGAVRGVVGIEGGVVSG